MTVTAELLDMATLKEYYKILFGALADEEPEKLHERLISLSLADVRKAFRRQAFQYHPAVVRELPQAFRQLRQRRFLQLTEAYTNLRRHLSNSAPAHSQSASEASGQEVAQGEKFAASEPSPQPGSQFSPLLTVVANARKSPQPKKAAPKAAPTTSRRSHDRAPLSVATESASPTLLAIGGAKGGTGQSVLAVNLALALARTGRRIVLADTDLGSPNTHVLLGMQRPQYTLHDYLTKTPGAGSPETGAGSITRLDDALGATPHERVSLLAGSSDVLGNANLPAASRRKLIYGLRRLDADVVILDLGGDTATSVLDFFLAADLGVVVTTMEPASILDAYQFIKLCALRRIQRYLAEHPAPESVEAGIGEVFSVANLSGVPVPGLLSEVAHLDPLYAEALSAHLRQLRLFSVITMRQRANDGQLVDNLRGVCARMAGLKLSHLGTIPNDPAVVKSANELRPVLPNYPLSPASLALQHLAGALPLPAPASDAEQQFRAIGEWGSLAS